MNLVLLCCVNETTVFAVKSCDFFNICQFKICFLAGDIQRLPDALGSTLFKFLLAPDTVSVEHLSIEAVQVSLSLKHFKNTMFYMHTCILDGKDFIRVCSLITQFFLIKMHYTSFITVLTLTVFYFLAHCSSC